MRPVGITMCLGVLIVLVGVFDDNGTVGLIGLAVVIVGGLWMLPRHKPSATDDVDEFAQVSAIETTNASRHFIAYYLLTGVRLRTILVLASLFLPSLVGTALGLTGGTRFTANWQAILAACLVGTIWAELALTRPAGKVRVASLRPRDVGSYLGRPLQWSPVAVSAVAAGTWLGASLLPAQADNGLERGSRAELIVGLGFALVLPALVALTQRWIVTRPQPFSVTSLVDADDAVRAASVRYLGAVGTAMALLNLSGGAWQFVPYWSGPLDWFFGGLGVLSVLAAWYFWNARKPGVLMRPRQELRPWATAG